MTLLNELFFSTVLAALMYFVYYRSYSKLTYNKKFNITLVMVAFGCTFMMLLIQDDLAVSFGVMGTLSIIRFRANVKDNRDIGFILWALVIGLSVGTSNFVIAVVYSVTMTIYMCLSQDGKLTLKNYLLIVRGTNYTYDLDNFICGFAKGIRLKAKNLTKETFELVYDINLGNKQEENILTEAILSQPNVISANLLSPNSEME
ncbi:MAG TPA: DUF4956 domain-containing protein [Bacillota bacterium]|nr:DUF4956 domain-containing protein [Bacillota bacterium]